MRPPVVAGQFYAGTRAELLRQIEECYLSEHGPGRLPRVGKGLRKVVGLVSPHAGYMYSGPVAAHGFARVAEDGLPARIVILGPNHTGAGSGVSIVTSGRWRTPLGEVPIDGDLGEEIKAASDIIDVDTTAHAYEHSIEVQLPFLQHLFGDAFKIVPICLMLQDESTSLEVGDAIAKAAAGSDILIIASTDFTHYEPQRYAVEKDRMVIERIVKMDPRGVVRVVDEEGITMCGYGPVAAMLQAAKRLGAKRAELLKYATSGDTAGPMAQVVGYASIAVSK
ncbi:MAG: AmmeMemoRadiSam system protein B [Candidatus Hadarchaeum sp.]|uniref:AmmeMemoRadiSam system protein B n=1 Tax=Candidatus Hadarchaeum sp. TaxID=2883567 RepID=UPI003D101889